ncbi:FGGY-family carbohydrate kinase [Herbiconiux sp. A18JL235]|uniref:FGGY-family carbohydrate kinase n=1 Tax=Herbiconiux sp. A18JL235 TaxID=3152363 RepID=A0AB39BFJ9_9MICO
MPELALAFDLGTGGCKAAAWSADGSCVAETAGRYATHHPSPGRAEQRPADWWDAVVASTRELAEQVPDLAQRVSAIALSGQSLGIIPLDAQGGLVLQSIPIWSDTRGAAHTAPVFDVVPEEEWYRRTGNGFGAALYPLFKAGALRAEHPDGWAATRTLVGSKDWINLRLTGRLATDHSYASGSGAYSLESGAYDDELLAAAGFPRELLVEPGESADPVGELTHEAAEALGLRPGIPVFAGAVDNAAMALGSRGTAEGRIYAALGSSSWMTVTSARPVIDVAARPYVFRHAVPGLHVSALSTFSSGTSFDWWRGLLAPGLDAEAVVAEALTAPPGSNGLTFLPMLAGGTPLEGGPDARGAITGATLGSTRAELLRASLEGIAFALRRSLDRIRELSGTRDELTVSGGGAQSEGWNRLYADVVQSTLVRTSVDQQAATLGAATIAFVGLGAWQWGDADRPHRVVARIDPDPRAAGVYDDARARFDAALAALAPTTLQEDPR